MAYRSPGARGGGARAGRRCDSQRQAAADRRRWRRRVFGGVGAAARVCGGHRHPGRRHPRRQGRDQLGSPERRRWCRIDRHIRGECPCGRSGCRYRHRHALFGLHDGKPHDLRRGGRPLRQYQYPRFRRGQARRDDAPGRCPRGAHGAHRRAGRMGGRRGIPAAGHRSRRRVAARGGRVLSPRPRAVARADRSFRRAERADGPRRCCHQCGRLDARRSPMPMARNDSQPIPRRVRLLVHGL